MARIEPPISETTQPFWEATKAQKFLVQWCTACSAPIFYPREVCPKCLSSESLEWRESQGKGSVYAFSIQHRPANPMMADRVPYAVALVELEAGGTTGEGVDATIRLMSNVINVPVDEIVVGMPVTVTWEPLSDGRNLPQFQPAS